jgi:hypothetical protein
MSKTETPTEAAAQTGAKTAEERAGPAASPRPAIAPVTVPDIAMRVADDEPIECSSPPCMLGELVQK